MDSTAQARPTSNEKPVLYNGAKLPMTSPTRATPTKKTMPVIQNQVPFKAATG